MNTSRKRFTNQEDTLLVQHWGKNAVELSEFFPFRTYEGLKNRANHLQLRKNCNHLPNKVTQLTEIELGYFAGHFDGEGCILMRKHKTGTFGIRVSMNIGCQEIIQKYYSAFGGETCQVKGTNKPLWCWRLTGFADCKHFLDLLTPYLIEKQSQAKIALDWLNWRIQKTHRYNFSSTEIASSENVFKKLKELKL